MAGRAAKGAEPRAGRREVRGLRGGLGPAAGRQRAGGAPRGGQGPAGGPSGGGGAARAAEVRAGGEAAARERGPQRC